MRFESVVFAIAGMLFGVIVGWVIGSQQAGRGAAAPAAAATQEAPAQNAASGTGERQPAVLDEARVQALMTVVQNDTQNAEARVQLGNVYFDAERFTDAVKWYEEALKLDPKNVNASTDLGVSYYYVNQPDRALQQFDYSLRIDPAHTKTFLNQGIVRAFGKQDLAGAAQSWQRVVELAPDSPEGQAARRALDSLKAAHPAGGSPQGSS